MKDIKLDATGDITIIDRDLQLVSENLELAQRIEMVLSIAKEEWFLNPSIGMDREPFFSKQFNEILAKDSIIEAVGQIDEVDTVQDITFTRVERVLFVTLSIVKKDGETLQNIEVML